MQRTSGLLRQLPDPAGPPDLHSGPGDSALVSGAGRARRSGWGGSPQRTGAAQCRLPRGQQSRPAATKGVQAVEIAIRFRKGTGSAAAGAPQAGQHSAARCGRWEAGRSVPAPQGTHPACLCPSLLLPTFSPFSVGSLKSLASSGVKGTRWAPYCGHDGRMHRCFMLAHQL